MVTIQATRPDAEVAHAIEGARSHTVKLRIPFPFAGLTLAMILVVAACTSSDGDATPDADLRPTNESVATATPVGATQTVAPTVELPATAAPTTSPAPTLSPDLVRLLSVIEGRVVKERGLVNTSEATRKVVTREEIGEIIAQDFEEDADLEEIRAIQNLLILLGLLDDGDDLLELLIALNSSQVIGQFNLRSGELYIVSDGAEFGVLEEYTYAHEYTHALQQGSFNLLAERESREDDSEASGAYTALVEGDASLLSGAYLGEYLNLLDLVRAANAVDVGGLDDAPFVLQESLVFPYREGLAFVTELYRQGGWRAVDDAYRDPPSTTEQILHPEKYRQREGRVEVTLPDIAAALGDGWVEVRTESIGEFDLRILLQSQLSASEASRGAAGWGGDRYALLDGPAGQRVLVSLVRWDTEQDASEFFDAYNRLLERRGADVDRAPGSLRGVTPDSLTHSLRIGGDETLLIITSEAALIDRIAPLFPGV